MKSLLITGLLCGVVALIGKFVTPHGYEVRDVHPERQGGAGWIPRQRLEQRRRQQLGKDSRTVKPLSSLTVVENFMGGPESSESGDWRQLSDTVATAILTPYLSVDGNYDYGRDKQSGATVTWQGVAGYARFHPNAWFALSPRAEYYNDTEGFTSGTAQKLKEFTLTGELKHKDGVLMRLEYRRDFSEVAVFVKEAGRPVKNQNTLTIGFVYAFSTKTS